MHIQLLRADVQSLKLDAMVAGEAGEGVPVTTGGNLLARFVIHVHVPTADEPDAQAKLRQTTLTAFDKAEELAVGSVGLPALGTGSGFGAESCARIMIEAALEHATHARSLQRAVFCLFGRDEHAVFKRVLGELGPR